LTLKNETHQEVETAYEEHHNYSHWQELLLKEKEYELLRNTVMQLPKLKEIEYIGTGEDRTTACLMKESRGFALGTYSTIVVSCTAMVVSGYFSGRFSGPAD
jgi:hypothetical protein